MSLPPPPATDTDPARPATDSPGAAPGLAVLGATADAPSGAAIDAASPAPATPAPAAANPLAGDTVIGSPQRWWFIPCLVISWFGSQLAVGAILGSALPKFLTIADPATKEARLAAVTAVGGVVVMIITPLFGRLSDRTMSRWGMRKPWIAGGILVGVSGTAVLAGASALWQMVVGWCVVQIGFGAVQMAQYALLADQVPGRIRARVSGAVGLAGGIATVASAAVVAALPIDRPWTWFLVPGLFALLATAPMLVAYRDAVRSVPPEPLHWRDVVSTYWLDPRRHRDLALAWVSRFLMTLAIFTVLLFSFFLIVDMFGVPVADVGAVQTRAMVIFLAGSLVSTVLAGWVSDKLKRRKAIVWTTALLSATGLAIILATGSLTGFYVGFAVVGIAQGAYVTVDVALMTELLPSARDAGKDLGIVSLSYQLPQVLAPLIGATVIASSGGSYSGLLALAVVCAILGGLVVIPIRSAR